MYAASSPVLPAVGCSGSACLEVIGELVDASFLSSEDYGKLLKELDCLEDFNGWQHPDNMYERIRCEVQLSPALEDPSPSSVVAWAYEYCISPPKAYRLVPDGNWPSMMRSENRKGAGPDWQDAQCAAEPRIMHGADNLGSLSS